MRPPRTRLRPMQSQPNASPPLPAHTHPPTILGAQFLEAKAYSGFIEGWFFGTHEEGLGYKPLRGVAAPPPLATPLFFRLPPLFMAFRWTWIIGMRTPHS